MGIPKFYRWISERYPCLSDVVDDQKIPDFDNLYLDMNGIIHNCSHPSDDPHFRMSEEDMFKDIFHYLEVLFRKIRPQKVFFMAVDGVAPRAKMNQQRGRRFKTAHAAEEAEKKARSKTDNKLPEEPRFDSNCITPGTSFMMRLDEQLKYFIANKISSDSSWQSCQVIYSGHQTPGEGEHKIMDYIRFARSQPDYDPNTRHCLYGLDADLMMLGLASHEPKFTLLREQVKFGKQSQKKKTSVPEEIEFHLLHLSLMRDYINYEFSDLHSASCGYDLEAIIDDFVFLSFLVGNDFIPHLPGLHINKEGLPIIHNIYKKVFSKMNGYLNEKGTLNLERFEIFMEELTGVEIEQFHEINADMKYLRSKQNNAGEMSEFDVGFTNADISDKYKQLGLEGMPDFLHSDSDESEEDTFAEEFTLHKHNYYREKMGFETVTAEVLSDQAMNYVQGLQWILNYYYNGVCSWSWFYPFHYAPYISDIKNFKHLVFNFNKGHPFKPFEQLLAVLPPMSANLLPTPYHSLMFQDDSIVKGYYPRDFKTDLNGKVNDWEAVVLVPFIDENILLQAMKPCNEKLTDEEKSRNTECPFHIYKYNAKSLGEYKVPAHFPPIAWNHAEARKEWRSSWEMKPEDLRKGILPHANTMQYFEGFPTLKYVPHDFELRAEGVKLFEYATKSYSYILLVKSKIESLTKEYAESILRKSIYVQWPHLREARVVSISDESNEYIMIDGSIASRELSPEEKLERKKDMKHLWEMSRCKRGISTKCNITVKVNYRAGLRYTFNSDGVMKLEKLWRAENVVTLLDTSVVDLEVFSSNHDHSTTLADFFVPGSTVFMLGQPHYGSFGLVKEKDTLQKGRVRVFLVDAVEPNLFKLSQTFSEEGSDYWPAHYASQHVNISANIFSRITGVIFVSNSNSSGNKKSKLNIGMDLKNNKHDLEVSGYTHKCTDTGKWFYSRECVNAVGEYIGKFPEIFSFLTTSGTRGGSNDENFTETDIFPDDHQTKIVTLKKWLENSPFRNARKQKSGTARVPQAAIPGILAECSKVSSLKAKALVVQVKPHLLFKPNRLLGSSSPDPNATFELWDRVVNVREGYSVPLKARGTIIGCAKKVKADSYYEVLFDERFAGGLELAGEKSAGRCYKMMKSALINISHGLRKSSQTPLKTKDVAAMNSYFWKNKDGTPAKARQNSTPKSAAIPNTTSPEENELQPPAPCELPSISLFNRQKPHKLQSPQRRIESLVFGTDYRQWSVIREKGIFKMDRQYVICREKCQDFHEVVIHLDLEALSRSKAHIQYNGEEILCSTNAQGFLEPKFFKKVIDMKSGHQLHPTSSDSVSNVESMLGNLRLDGPNKYANLWDQMSSQGPKVVPPRSEEQNQAIRCNPTRFVPLQVCLKQTQVPDNRNSAQSAISLAEIGHPTPPTPIVKQQTHLNPGSEKKKKSNRTPKGSRLAASLPGVGNQN